MFFLFAAIRRVYQESGLLVWGFTKKQKEEMDTVHRAKILMMALLLCFLCGCGAAPEPPAKQEAPSQSTQLEKPVQPTAEQPASPSPAAVGNEVTPQKPEKSAFEVLPAPQPDPASQFGVDVNVNMSTIDGYLGLADTAYIDMRMTIDPYDYEAIGGNSILTNMIEGFRVMPYPYLAPCPNMPEELGKGYGGPTLFAMDEQGKYSPNYKESLAIVEAVFPKDKAIILMCGAGGYAGLTKQMLVSLGWDESPIFNVGGLWFYEGKHSIVTGVGEGKTGIWSFSGFHMSEIDFSALTPMN